MNVAIDVLRHFIAVPEDPRQLRELLDDTGLEVKRFADGVFTLELLANRGDHHCYEGIARELNGRLGLGVCVPEVAALEAGPSPFPVLVESDLCPVYTATLLERKGEGGTLGADERRVLDAAGIHSISLPVDASNLANLELGQPTHSFDADTITGALRVRLSAQGERAWPLFAEARVELPVGTLVIADDEKILAVAGVIGCEESKTTESTRRILLESAHFDPVAVRKASRALGITTDSSARFERGSDPARAIAGAGRVVHLLEKFGPWHRVGPAAVLGDWHDPVRVVSLNVAAAAAYLAMDLDAARITELLERYGFIVTGDAARLAVRVPTWRLWDVAFAADLYEELAKAIGYDNTPTRLPPVDQGVLPSETEHRRSICNDVLVGHGFFELFTDGFYSRALRDRLGITEGHALWRHVETANALDRAYSLLKNSCLPQAVEAVATNLRVRNTEVAAFEWTQTFHLQPFPAVPQRNASPCTERGVLWAIVSGRDRPHAWQDTARPADVFFLKGLIEELGRALDLDLRTGPVGDDPLRDLLHPGRQAAVLLHGQPVGVLGEVHPAICQAFKLKNARPCYFELSTDALFGAPAAHPSYVEPPARQPMERSLAFSLPPRVEAGAVAALLKSGGPDWLDHVDIVDLFAHDEAGVPMRAVTFDLVFSASEADRTSDEVNAVLSALIEAVHGRFGEAGVKLRT